ncbi:MAG: 4Fe-4S binding protein [Chloroflexi bacterium]|jgi:ferredoxin|nr:4Fe-4S binding protein [Chloroflexota bacterium]MCK4243153.1 4Fe-4S binding protein [Dehalococcoidia bacterium]
MAEKKYAISLNEVEAEYQELAARINYDGSKYLPWIFKKALTLEQARVALELYISSEEVASTLGISEEEAATDAQKYQLAAIAKRLNLDKETVTRHVQYMFELGFAFPTRRGWRFARNVAQLKDSQTNTKFDEELGDQYFDLWEAFQKIEGYPTGFLWELLPRLEAQGPIFRVIPARKSLKDIPDIVPEDNIEEVLRLYETTAVSHCPCKRLVRDRACHSPTEVCLVLDRVAEHNVRRGTARVISLGEALAIHDMAADAGLVCNAQGIEAKPITPMICHCHWCCCDEFAPLVMHNIPLQKLIASSCYQAEVDPDKCTGCQTCVTRCQFGAIEMKRYAGAGRQEKFKAWVDPDKCVGCGLCVIKCPSEARTMKQVKTSESIPKEGADTAGYTTAASYRKGKHLDTGSVMTRPVY